VSSVRALALALRQGLFLVRHNVHRFLEQTADSRTRRGGGSGGIVGIAVAAARRLRTVLSSYSYSFSTGIGPRGISFQSAVVVGRLDGSRVVGGGNQQRLLLLSLLGLFAVFLDWGLGEATKEGGSHSGGRTLPGVRKQPPPRTTCSCDACSFSRSCSCSFVAGVFVLGFVIERRSRASRRGGGQGFGLCHHSHGRSELCRHILQGGTVTIVTVTITTIVACGSSTGGFGDYFFIGW